MFSRQASVAFVCAIVAVFILCVNVVHAFPADHKAPTKPTNLRVTGVTPWAVSLTWNPSTDNSGSFTYRIVCSNGYSMTVPQSSTSCVFTNNLQHQGTYSFHVNAFDAAGNVSQNSNKVTVTLPKDITAPSAPVVSLVNIGPTHAVLSWSATDDDPTLIFAVYKDGVLFNQPSSATSATAFLLEPSTSYTFTVKARDSAGNWSSLSAPFVATTEAPDQNDVMAPTMPINLWGGSFSDGTAEFFLNWSPSTDNVTPQQYIRYDLYINGVWSGVTVGSTSLTEYGVSGLNVIELIAVDAAGNESEAAVILLNLQ